MSEERRRRPDADASRFFLGQAQGHQPLEQDHHEMPAAHARVEGFDGSQTVPVWLIFKTRAGRSGYLPVWLIFISRARRSGYFPVCHGLAEGCWDGAHLGEGMKASSVSSQ